MRRGQCILRFSCLALLCLLLSCVVQDGVARKIARRQLHDAEVEGGDAPAPAANATAPGNATQIDMTEMPDEIPANETLVGENITATNDTLGNFTIVPELENPLMGETITLEQAASEPIPDGSLDVLLPNNELDMDPDDLQMGNPP